MRSQLFKTLFLVLLGTSFFSCQEKKTVLPKKQLPDPQRELLLKKAEAMYRSGEHLTVENLEKEIMNLPVFDAVIQVDPYVKEKNVLKILDENHVELAFIHDVNRKTEIAPEAYLYAKKYPDRFLLGTRKFVRGWQKDQKAFVDRIEKELQDHPIYGISELHFNHNCKYRQNHINVTVNPMNPQVHRVAEMCAKYNIPFYVHYEPMAEGNMLKDLDRLFKAHPKTNFIWNHGGWESIEVMDRMLLDNPNLYITIAKRYGVVATCDSGVRTKINETRRLVRGDASMGLPQMTFFRHFNRQILFASDAHTPDLYKKNYTMKLTKWKKALSKVLSPMHIRRIFHLNAIRLFFPEFRPRLKQLRKEEMDRKNTKGKMEDFQN